MVRTNLPGDVFGGVTSAIVMLPMALAFGVASGLGPVAGIYGAVAVGFFAAVFGGTPSQISGPTGPMTVAMAAIVTLYADSLATAFTIVMLAGLFQIALGVLRIGSFVSYTPYSVISGFMTGIGVIIMVLQVIPFLGADPVSGGPLAQIAAWPDALADAGWHDLVVGAVALAVCVLWPRRMHRFLPAPLAALVTGTCLALFLLTGGADHRRDPCRPARASGAAARVGIDPGSRGAGSPGLAARLDRQSADLARG